MRTRPRSLQGRLLASLLGTVVLVWLAATIATWLDLRHELGELLDSHLAQAAALLVVQANTTLDDDQRRPEAPQLHRYGPKVAFQVWHGARLSLRSANAPDAPMVAAAVLADVLAGYEDFHEFDSRELHLVEALRTLRLIHYAGWLARRWDDPAFPAAFPWFNSQRYWQERILELREQIALMDEPPLWSS